MWLTIRSGGSAGETVEVTGASFVVGREKGCELVLEDEQASRRHAALERLPDGRLAVRDLGSRNGTFVDGRRIEQPTVLTGSEEVRIGNTLLAVSGTPSPAAAPTPSRLERIVLLRSARRAQRIAAAAGVGLVVAIVVVVLAAAGVFSGSEAPTAADVIEAAKPSTVQIRRFVAEQSENGGSGWVYDAAQGLAVTNAHVVNAAARFAVRLAGEERERPAEIVGVAPCEDLAVLRVEDTAGLQTMPLGSQTRLQQGETVLAIGYPVTLAAEENLVANEGVVSIVKTRSIDLYYTGALPNVIQTTARTNPGNSGGPLLNLGGELVGVVTFSNVQPGFEGQRYAIGVDRARLIVPQLAEGSSIGWTGIGFYQPESSDELAQMGLPAQPGLVIANVVPGTPAAEASLPVPSLIVAVNGAALDWTVGSYCRLVGSAQAGDTAVFSVIAPGATTPTDVTVGFR